MESAARMECVATESLSRIEQRLSGIPDKTGNQWLAPTIRNVLSGVFLIVSVWLPIHLQKIDAKVQGTADKVQAETNKRTGPLRKKLLSHLQAIDGYVGKIYSAYLEKSEPSPRGLSNASLVQSLGDLANLIENPPIDVEEEVIGSLKSYKEYVAYNWDGRMNRLNADQRKQIYDETKSLLADARGAIDNWH